MIPLDVGQWVWSEDEKRYLYQRPEAPADATLAAIRRCEFLLVQLVDLAREQPTASQLGHAVARRSDSGSAGW